MGTWLNSDGLYIKFGTDEAEVGKAGEFSNTGDLREVMVEFDLADLTTSGDTILDDNVVIPKNARIEAVETVVITAADSAGDTATLDVGLIRTDRSTALDADGLVVTAAQTTIDAAGEKTVITKGGTDAGALIGTTLANSGLLVAKAGTEVFTAGRLRVRVQFVFL